MTSEVQISVPTETPEQTRQADEAAFAAVNTKDEAAPSAPPAGTNAEAAPDPEGTEKSAEPSAPDPWEGVPPVVRQTLEDITGKLGAIDTLSRDVKTATGRVAAIQSELATAKAAAKTTEHAPTATQIEAASKSVQKWDALKTDFPEWTEAMEERFAIERAELLKQLPKPATVDVDGIRNGVNESVSAAIKRARQYARVDAKYESWEEDVHTPNGELTPKFAAWMKTQAPDIQALADSENASDAIKMIGLYYDDQKAQAARDKKQQRLESAIPARGTPGQRQPTQSERDAEEKAFASA